MTIAELINIAGFVIMLVGLGAVYGKLNERLNNLVDMRKADTIDQKARNHDEQGWRLGEHSRVDDYRRHEMLEQCQKQFSDLSKGQSEIRESLAYIKGKMQELVNKK